MIDLLKDRVINRTSYRRRSRTTGIFETREEWEKEVKRLTKAGTRINEISKKIGSTQSTIHEYNNLQNKGY